MYFRGTIDCPNCEWTGEVTHSVGKDTENPKTTILLCPDCGHSFAYTVELDADFRVKNTTEITFEDLDSTKLHRHQGEYINGKAGN